MLEIENSVVVLIDIQERLVGMLNKQEPVVKASSILLNAANIMNIPAILTEQYPQGLGKTVCELETVRNESNTIIEKTSFSAMSTSDFIEKIKSYGKKNIIIGGIETHICVYQTVLDLLKDGYNVVVVKDACASRSSDCFKTGIQLMKDAGAQISNVETVLFELLKTSKSPYFKPVQALIK